MLEHERLARERGERRVRLARVAVTGEVIGAHAVEHDQHDRRTAASERLAGNDREGRRRAAQQREAHCGECERSAEAEAQRSARAAPRARERIAHEVRAAEPERRERAAGREPLHERRLHQQVAQQPARNGCERNGGPRRRQRPESAAIAGAARVVRSHHEQQREARAQHDAGTPEIAACDQAREQREHHAARCEQRERGAARVADAQCALRNRAEQSARERIEREQRGGRPGVVPEGVAGEPRSQRGPNNREQRLADAVQQPCPGECTHEPAR